MSGLTHLRLAAFCAVAYGLLLVSGIVHHFQRTGSLRALFRSVAYPGFWIVLLVVVLVMYGLFKRHAWAWWLGIAAALFQLFRIVSAYVQGPSAGRVPSTPVLISLVLLVVFVLLLLPRKARLASNR
jgi:hypothetical protein